MDRQKKTTNLVKNLKTYQKHSKIRKIIVLSIIILIISALCLFFNALNPVIVSWLKNDFSIVSGHNNLIVHFVDVGQGDAIAISLPDNKLAVIDAGPNNERSSLVDYLNERVFNFKRNKTIDYLILTHADADHIGGAIKLIAEYDIGTLYMPTIETDTATYLTLSERVNEKHLNVEHYSNALNISGKYNLKFFAPLSYTDTNNTCPLIKLEFGGKSFLFTGDIEAKAEKDYIELYGNELDVDVLKVGHHGSKYSSCEEFLAVTTPKYAIVSSDNQYGHPNEETIERLNDVNANIVRTDTAGNIMFVVGNDYDLSLLTGDYIVTGFIFDYRIIVLIIDVALIGNVVIILIKKDKIHKN